MISCTNGKILVVGKMKRHCTGSVIDLCSESSDDDEKRPRLCQNEGSGTAARVKGLASKRKYGKRTKFAETAGSSHKVMLQPSSLATHQPNVAPLIFLKEDDNATLTVINADECNRCFAPKASAVTNKISVVGTKNQQLIHIHQHDRWSCGFRNWQMILSFLVPRLRPDHAFFRSPIAAESSLEFFQVPSVSDLQISIEQSWVNGFDVDGARHYHGKIVGKRAWIGALEVSGCLSSWGIDSVVVQFIRCPESRQELKPFCLRYFSSNETNGCSECGARQSSRRLATRLLAHSSLAHGDVSCSCGCQLPLYLQWEGHSVTIIGVEETAKSSNLLILNPSKSDTVMGNAIRNQKLAPFRLPFTQLLKKDTQILLPSLYSLSIAEQEGLKGRGDALTAATEHVKRICGL